MAAGAQTSVNSAAGKDATAVKSEGCSPAMAVTDSSTPTQALKHNPGLASEWTTEEQSVLEDGLSKYATEPSIVRFAKIAMLLSEKTVRDIALRCKWMTKRENGKRKKDELNGSSKKSSKKGLTDTAKASQMPMRPSIPPFPILLPMEMDDDVSSNAIGGLTGELFEQNALCFSQISTNLASYQAHENINLFRQIWDNIRTIINDMNSGAMDHMPPLPTKVNEELANSILPANGSMQMQS